MDRTEIAVEFPARIRAHRTSKDFGLRLRSSLVSVILLRATHTTPSCLTTFSDNTALSESGRACSTKEPPGGTMDDKQESVEFSCQVSVGARMLILRSLTISQTAALLVSHRPDIQTVALHTMMWGSMITGDWDVDEVCRIDAITDRMLTLLCTTRLRDDLDISTPVNSGTGKPYDVDVVAPV